jgi:hypothetical protein
LVFVTEVRALGRARFAMKHLVDDLHELRRRHGRRVYFGDLDFAIRPFDADCETYLFDAGDRAEREAKVISRRNRQGRRDRTADGAVTGPFPCAVAGPLPPPLATARVRDPRTGRPIRVAYLDTPACRPHPDTVIGSLPGRIDPDTGELADMVQLLRWHYSHHLTDGWDTLATAEHLIAHGYSTEGARRRNGRPDAAPILRSGKLRARDAGKIVRLLRKHRSFHLTGDLRLAIGAPSGDDDDGGLEDLHLHLHDVIRDMHAGVPARTALRGRWQEGRIYLRAALGLPPGIGTLVIHVDDPRLLRLAMAVNYPLAPGTPPPFTGTRPGDVLPLVAAPLTRPGRARLADHLGESGALLDRLTNLHGRGKLGASWLRDRNPRLATAVTHGFRRVPPTSTWISVRLTRDGHPLFERTPYGALRVVRCRRCGSRRRRLSRLREVTGLVCLNCRTDDTGVAWPAIYDRYLDLP